MSTEVRPAEKTELRSFEDDTLTLGRHTETFLHEFYPVYELTQTEFQAIETVSEEEILRQFVFYRIVECTIYDVEDKFAYFADKMQKIFTAAYAMQQTICYGLVSRAGETALVLGLQNAEGGAQRDEVKIVVQGLFPGIKLEECNVSLSRTVRSAAKIYEGCVSGVPALKIDGVYQERELSVLMRALNGQNYTMLTLCRPMSVEQITDKINAAIRIQDQSFAISKRTISIQEGYSEGNTHTNSYNETDSEGTTVGVSAAPLFALAGLVYGGPAGALAGGLIGTLCGINVSKNTGHQETYGYSDAVSQTISNNQGVTADVQNGFALELMKMAETQLERLKIGRNIGMWESFVSFSSDRALADSILRGYLYSEMATGLPEVLPPVTLSRSVQRKDGTAQMMIPKEFFSGKTSQLCSLLTSEELCGICTIPMDNTVGFELRESKGYALNYAAVPAERVLGQLCEYDRLLGNVPFGLDDEALNKHTFVCGITGSGKTNTVKKILTTAKKPFLVVEPAKKEYRNIVINGELTVYTLGRPELNSLRMNPFYIMPGISPQQHIDALKDLFSASFGFYGPMPYIFEKCLYRIYERRGWNLVFGFHPCFGDRSRISGLFEEAALRRSYEQEGHHFFFPTMQDLKEEIDYYLEHEMEYDHELKGNIKSAIKARIDSLCVGAKGYLFNTVEFPDMKEMLGSNVVIELEGLADDADKAFGLGLLIIYVNECRQTAKELGAEKGLQHLLVIEEAHRLLKNVPAEMEKEVGNAKGKAVEHFTNMLAEMRSYGQGVIVAEQIPTKIAPDVIKNSSNKIIHRIVAKDDQEAVANTIGVHPADAIYLGNSQQGYALCHTEGMVQPVIVKFDEVRSNRVLDVRFFEKGEAEKIAAINRAMMTAALHREILDYSGRALMSLMYVDDAERIYRGCEMCKERLERRLREENVILIPEKAVHNRLAECVCEGVGTLLAHGVFSGNRIPTDTLLAAVRANLVGASTQEKLAEAKKELTAFYGRDTKELAVKTAAGLCAIDYKQGKDLAHSMTEYLLLPDKDFYKDVKCVYERRA